MKRKIKVITLALLFVPLIGFGGVRTIYTNDQRMTKLTLRMGKSTVLRFPSKPIKAVMGNPDLFDVEFIGKDLTLRPKRMVETNIFIYTKERTFGFLIGVKNGREYDDLVHVKWKRRFYIQGKNR